MDHLKQPQGDPIQEIVSRFVEAWSGLSDHAKSIDLTLFLPEPGDPLRPAALLQLISTDLEMRWRTGRPISLEHYFDVFPELGSTRSVPPALIVAEYQARVKH